MSNKLTIRQIELYKLSIPLKEPFTTSLGTETSADNVLVKIITEEGITGFGECSPYMPINGESQDTCFIVGQYFSRALKVHLILHCMILLRNMQERRCTNSSVGKIIRPSLQIIR